MDKESEQLKEALEDLKYIKKVLKKTSGVFRFLPFEKAIRVVSLPTSFLLSLSFMP